MKAGLTVGELAGELQLNPKTMRYYEEIGLLPEPRRSESGYRLYSRYEMERLRLVKRTKLLGLSLAEIKKIVEYPATPFCDVQVLPLSDVDHAMTKQYELLKKMTASEG